MTIIEAVRMAATEGKQIYRESWGKTVKLCLDDGAGYLNAWLWDEAEPTDARWIPTADDLLDDDWEAAGGRT